MTIKFDKVDPKTAMLLGALLTSGSCIGSFGSQRGCGSEFAMNRAYEVDSIINTQGYPAISQRAVNFLYSPGGRGVLTLVGLGGLAGLVIGGIGALTKRREDNRKDG